MKRLPVKSLIRFRSVSKPWKSLIDGSKFIIDHISHHDHPQDMLIRYADYAEGGKYVSIVDNDTFPQHQFPLIAPESVTGLAYSDIGGCDQGLFCFYTLTGKATIWNPSIRKSVDIDVPIIQRGHRVPYDTFISFGVSPKTMDPKLVKITYISNHRLCHDKISTIPRQVEVFALSTRVWRSLSINLPRLCIRFNMYNQVVIDGLIYWLAHNTSDADGDYYLIMSFDLTSEEFTEIDYLPIELALNPGITLSKLRDSLVVLKYCVKAQQIGVWVMENSSPKPFTKLFNIERSGVSAVLGFRKSGEPIIVTRANKDYKNTPLYVYDPYSQNIDNIGTFGMAYNVSVHSYTETLILLNQ